MTRSISVSWDCLVDVQTGKKRVWFVPCNNNIDCEKPFWLLNGKTTAHKLQESQTGGSAIGSSTKWGSVLNPSGHLIGGQSLYPLGMWFHLVQPWVGLAVGKSKRFIGAWDRYPLWSSVHHHPSFISPTCLLYQSPTAPNIWWLSKNLVAIRGANLTSENRHPRQRSAHLLPH